ncbi:hypothetical protein SAMN04487775_10294 [Treponema bryantii]|uniref:Lipoprotein n=1 Tax=Treponema bryantii TaxID=163 RepID=A0A1I3IRY7_9SPIR|nr:hypothetical protein [Treponema bryantii]SFI50652.1 hypothetical protein SAMN04487775_10294 [Treponema bryantii]
MKKLVKVTALLLVAAAMFAGCKNNVEEEQPAKDAPLFSKDDVSITIDVNDIEVTDGDWVASVKDAGKIPTSDMGSEYPFGSGVIEMINFRKVEFTVAGSNVTFTYGYEKESGTLTLDNDPTEAEIAQLKENGCTVNGRVATFEEEGDAPKSELDNMLLSDVLSEAYGLTIKTNADHTKYFGEVKQTKGDYYTSEEFYLMKK